MEEQHETVISMADKIEWATAMVEQIIAERDALRAQLAAAQMGTLDIISRALAGYMDDYKTPDGYVRWGQVTKDIAALFSQQEGG